MLKTTKSLYFLIPAICLIAVASYFGLKTNSNKTDLKMVGSTSVDDYSSYNWSRLPFDSNSFIDNSRMTGDKSTAFKVITMTSYKEISSAQMWGLSEISEIAIDCQNAAMQDLKIAWTEKEMGKGKIAHLEGPLPSFSVKNVIDGTFERNLFRFICS
jgi:hypothetical protein